MVADGQTELVLWDPQVVRTGPKNGGRTRLERVQGGMVLIEHAKYLVGLYFYVVKFS